jgi:hypothetical protein
VPDYLVTKAGHNITSTNLFTTAAAAAAAAAATTTSMRLQNKATHLKSEGKFAHLILN